MGEGARYFSMVILWMYLLRSGIGLWLHVGGGVWMFYLP